MLTHKLILTLYHYTKNNWHSQVYADGWEQMTLSLNQKHEHFKIHKNKILQQHKK